MELKRIYDHAAPPDKWVDRREVCPECQGRGALAKPDGSGVERCPKCEGLKTLSRRVPPIDHVVVHHTGSTAKQNFSTRLITAGVKEGWITMGQGKITLHTKPELLVYTIDKIPGRYCCHCGDKLDDDATGELARLHVSQLHAGKQSPDPECPAGYAQVNAYLCTLESSLHQRWGLTRTAEGHLIQNGKRYKGGRTIG